MGRGSLRPAGSPAVRWDWLAWGAIAVGAAVRLWWVLKVHPPQDYVESDMKGYVDRAVNAARGDADRYDLFFAPGTHLLLAAPLKLFGTGDGGLLAGSWLWWALSSVTPLFMWRFTRRLIDVRAAAVTAALCALNPLLIFYSGYFSSEVPALALVSGALWLLLKARQGAGRAAVASAAGAGVLAAAAVATRPQFGLNVALLALPLLWQARTAWRPLVAFAAAGVVVMAIVGSYNSRVADSPALLGESGGMVFFQGQCDVRVVTAVAPETGRVLSFGNPVAAQLNRGRNYDFPDRAGYDQGFFYRQGLDCVERNGLGQTSRLVRNLWDAGATTTPFPLDRPRRLEAAARAANLLAAMVFAAALVLGLLYVVRRRRRGAGWDGVGVLLLQLLTVVPVVMVFSSEPRYRILYDSFAVAILAALYFAARDALDGEALGEAGAQND